MQQFSFIDPFIDLFESALNVSGDNSPIFRSTFLLHIQSKRASEYGQVCRPKHVEQIQIDQHKDQ